MFANDKNTNIKKYNNQKKNIKSYSVEIGKYLSPVVRAMTWQQLVQRMCSKISFSQSASLSFRLSIFVRQT